MDDAVLGSIDVALKKARTSALFQANSDVVWEYCKPGAPAHALEFTNDGHVTEFIRAGLQRDLTLVELAQSVGLSTAHFAVMFRQSTGETPHQFVLRCRMERAKEMLRAGKARIVDVAVACGFKTQPHFARVFRQMYGATPREYRKDLIV